PAGLMVMQQKSDSSGNQHRNRNQDPDFSIRKTHSTPPSTLATACPLASDSLTLTMHTTRDTATRVQISIRNWSAPDLIGSASQCGDRSKEEDRSGIGDWRLETGDSRLEIGDEYLIPNP